MPTHKSAEKRLRTSKKANARNREMKSRMKTLVKKVEVSSDEASLKEAISFLDKAAGKGAVHPNQASRIKSRLTKLVHKKATPAAP
ncbi:MAG: 30S ribosomal protein S20 [Candidatus Zixiibacteriota bacterium]